MDKYNNQTLIAFLLSKGWKNTGKNERLYKLSPPDNSPVVFEEDDRDLFIPIYQKTSTYDRQMQPIIEFIADIYELDLEDFKAIVSLPTKNIKSRSRIMNEIAAFI